MDRKLDVGIIGAGAVVAGFHLPVLAALPGIRVKWVHDLDPARAQAVRKRFAIDAVAADIAAAPEVDAVLVATPVGARVDVMTHVASRRWHAFCEKPFASTPEEHERILGLMRVAGRRAGVGLVRRFYVSTASARHVVASELLGPVEEVLAGEGLRARKFGRSEWFQGDARASGGGVFAETGTHLVDQVLHVLDGAAIDLVQARQERVRGLEMDTRLKATVRGGKGASVPLTLGVSRLHDLYNGIVIRCRQGEVRLATDPEAAVELFDRRGNKVGSLPGAPKPGIFAAVRAEWLDFVEGCLRGREDGADEPDTGLLTTRFVAQAYARARVVAPDASDAPDAPDAPQRRAGHEAAATQLAGNKTVLA